MWGTATSSFQIEGSNDIDGKIRSIWDEFCDTPDKVKNGDHAKLACDHYNKFKEDFDLALDTSLNVPNVTINIPTRANRY